MDKVNGVDEETEPSPVEIGHAGLIRRVARLLLNLDPDEEVAQAAGEQIDDSTAETAHETEIDAPAHAPSAETESTADAPLVLTAEDVRKFLSDNPDFTEFARKVKELMEEVNPERTA